MCNDEKNSRSIHVLKQNLPEAYLLARMEPFFFHFEGRAENVAHILQVQRTICDLEKDRNSLGMISQLPIPNGHCSKRHLKQIFLMLALLRRALLKAFIWGFFKTKFLGNFRKKSFKLMF